MNMKYILMLMAVGLAQSVQAMPVLNMNTKGAESVTVFPDHLDRNLHYLAPTVFVVAKDENGRPNFSYLEYRNAQGGRRAILQTTLRPDFSYAEIEKAKNEIRKLNPAAQFTALPFEATSVNFVDSLKELLVSSDCKHRAGTVADEQSCAFRLSSRGIKVMRPMLKVGLTVSTSFKYAINGVHQNADGSYTTKQNVYEVAGRIGGPELAKYPELFRDERGGVIKGLFTGLFQGEVER